VLVLVGTVDELEVEVLVGVELVVVGVLVVVVVDLVVDVLEVQSLAASSATVLAPWLRLDDRVVLTVEGRLVTALVSAAAALLAGPH
jgi:hypothetical protein